MKIGEPLVFDAGAGKTIVRRPLLCDCCGTEILGEIVSTLVDDQVTHELFIKSRRHNMQHRLSVDVADLRGVVDKILVGQQTA